MPLHAALTSTHIRRAAIATLVAGAVAASAGCLSLQNRYRQTTAQRLASDVVYVEGSDDDKHRLDVWSPAEVPRGGAPVVIFIHGGFWRAGDRHYFEPVVGLYGNVGVTLAEQGIVAVIPSYRLYPQVTSVEQMLDDVAAVIRTTRARVRDLGGDPDRIVLAGHSAGGHLVALIATKPEALTARGLPAHVLQGVVPLSGIYDVVTSADNANPPTMKQELWDPFFGTTEQKRAASSLQHFGVVHHPPMAFVVGELDYQNCRRDFGNAKKAFDGDGDLASFHVIPGNSHEDMVLEIGTHEDEVTPIVVDFVRRVTARPSSSSSP